MTPKEVGDIVKVGTKVGIRYDCGSKVLEGSTGLIPSSMMKFVSLLDKSIQMFEISTSSLQDSVFETPDGLTIVFSGILVIC